MDGGAGSGEYREQRVERHNNNPIVSSNWARVDADRQRVLHNSCSCVWVHDTHRSKMSNKGAGGQRRRERAGGSVMVTPSQSKSTDIVPCPIHSNRTTHTTVKNEAARGWAGSATNASGQAGCGKPMRKPHTTDIARRLTRIILTAQCSFFSLLSDFWREVGFVVGWRVVRRCCRL